jgi:hypothetical protein
MGRHAKFHAIADALRERVRSGDLRSGDPLPSERGLASEFGVNRLTLRKALDVLTAEGLITRQHGRGSFVASPPPTAASAPVVYVGSTEEHYFQALHSRLCAEGQKRHRTVIAFNPSSEGADLSRLRSILADAYAVVCADPCWSAVCAVVPRSVSVVRVTGFHGVEPDQTKDSQRGCSVSTDPYRATKMAVEHLCARGHRRIGFLDAGNLRTEDPLLWRVRARNICYLGYRSALGENGIAEECVLGVPPTEIDGWEQQNAQASRQFLEGAGAVPTAFVCVGDFRAGPLIHAATEMGLRVPQDLSVIGIGNTPWSQWLAPPLTSVSLGEEELARLAMLLTQEAEMRPETIFRVTPRLVERGSVAVARS